MRVFDFDERLRYSVGVVSDRVELVLLDRIPGAVDVRKADTEADKRGTDFWVDRTGLPPLSVDMKRRAHDYGRDDVALETWSVVGKRVGWTLDKSKRTDYVLHLWDDSRRFFLVPFPSLCDVFTRMRDVWCDGRYKIDRQTTVTASGRWQSECVFVPVSEVVSGIRRWMCP